MAQKGRSIQGRMPRGHAPEVDGEEMKNKDMCVTKHFERPTCKDCVYLVIKLGTSIKRGWCTFQRPQHDSNNGLVSVDPDRPFCGNFYRLTEWIRSEQEMEALMVKGNKED